MAAIFRNRSVITKTAPVMVALALLLPAGCGKREAPEQAKPSTGATVDSLPARAATTAPATAPTTVPTTGPTTGPKEATPPPAAKPASPATTPPAGTTPAAAEPTEPATVQTPPAESAAMPPAEAAPVAAPNPATQVVDPGGIVEVEATKAGLRRVGAEKCKTCHAVQFRSWSTGAHARRTPPLDCESCHGAGSEYKTLAVMKDPAKARSAGLVMPGREFCVTCHRSGWSDDMRARAHAHKTAAGAR